LKPVVRRLDAAALVLTALLGAGACARAEPPPYTIIFDFAGDAALPAATLDSIAHAMAAVWYVHLDGAPRRVRVRVQEPSLSYYQPSSVPALFVPCQGRVNCVELFAIGLGGARRLREAMGAPASEPEWLAYIMAHEAVHLWQAARGDSLEATVADWRYGFDPVEREAFREAARFAGARRIHMTGSDDGTVTICPAGMPRRDCGYRREDDNPYIAALRNVRYRVIAD
jgi:hypothetical protein